MRQLVLDASVGVKWFVEEKYSDAALRLAESGVHWIVPDLFFSEVGNVLWKKVRLGEMDEADARQAMDGLVSFVIQVHESRSLVAYALDLALQFQCTVYDGLYLSVAIAESCPLVTADRKFYSTFSRTGLSQHLQWIEDVA